MSRTRTAHELHDHFLTVKEVSVLLNVPVATMRQWRHRGRGPKFTKMEGSIRYRLSAVRKYIADNERG